jgi:3-isopropylmalate dehydrogenase
MRYHIAVIPGDGIGPEVIDETIKVLTKISEKFSREFIFSKVSAGGAAIDKYGDPLPKGTLDACKASEAVLLGAVGGWKWDNLPGDKRPERALLGLRSGLELFCNLRPAKLYEALKDACPLRSEAADAGMDIMVVRELTGGMYFGDRGRKQTEMGEAAWDTEMYSYEEVRRIAVRAFDIARTRQKRLVNVDKANVLESSRLWRAVVMDVAKGYPDIELSHMYVDNAAMQLIRDPKQFDVLLTTNMFGDILSDEASQITGSIGMLPSASLGKDGLGMYEPIHGSAPDIAGKDTANPIATILSAAMMLEYSFGLPEEAKAVEDAVIKALNDGYRTGDIFSDGMKKVGTKEMGRIITENI